MTTRNKINPNGVIILAVTRTGTYIIEKPFTLTYIETRNGHMKAIEIPLI